MELIAEDERKTVKLNIVKLDKVNKMNRNGGVVVRQRQLSNSKEVITFAVSIDKLTD